MRIWNYKCSGFVCRHSKMGLMWFELQTLNGLASTKRGVLGSQKASPRLTRASNCRKAWLSKDSFSIIRCDSFQVG